MPSGSTIAARTNTANVPPIGIPAAAKPAGPPAFIVAVCQQPATSFLDWKALGVNTLVDVPQNHDAAAWRDAANAAGLWQIRAPIGDLATDAKDPRLLAWSHDDEPDLKKTDPAILAANRAKLGGNLKPWFLNVDGSRLLGIQDTVSRDTYTRLFATADLLCSDIYPVSGWDNNIPLESPGRATDRLVDWGGRKPVLQYVEFGYQGLENLPGGGHAPSPAEFKLQVRQAVARKCRGIVLFPLQVASGFRFKASTPELDMALCEVVDLITGVNPLAGIGK
jgi:hypothetical protein